MGKWYDISRRAIDAAYKEVDADSPELSPAEILQIINADYYPFGERAYFPYKAWRKALKDYGKMMGVRQAPHPVTGEGDLFA